MSGIWSDLTERHKKYAAIAMAVGTIFGLFASILGFLAAAIIFGSGLTLSGALTFLFRSKEEEDEARYRIWAIVGIIAIASGLLCFAFAVVGLYFHQQGSI
jgi:uncharacterized membrane protein HdeD (DUF308 family)